MLDRVIASGTDSGHALRNPEEIRTLILKLRWIGLEEEAEELMTHLAVVAPAATLTDATETD